MQKSVYYLGAGIQFVTSTSLTNLYEDCERLSSWNKLPVRRKEQIQRGTNEAFESGELVPLCPEQLGDLPTPRPPSRVFDGNGYAVLDGRTRVVNQRSGMLQRISSEGRWGY